MNQGYIKLYRSIKEWRWYKTPHMLEFWIHLLLDANWSDDEECKRGCIVTSIPELAKETGCSIKQVRTFLSRLSDTGEIKIDRARSTARMGTSIRTRITICNYDSYQGAGREVGQKVGHEVRQEPTIDTLYKEEEYKNIKKNKDTNVSRPKSSADSPDYDFVMELWNGTMTKVPKVRSLTSARKDKIRLRIKEMGGAEKAKELLAVCFKKIEESDFCNGTSGKWTATFDWFFDNEKNWLKVYEGNYDNRKPQSRIQQYADTANRFNALMDELYGPDDNGTANGAGYTPDEQ